VNSHSTRSTISTANKHRANRWPVILCGTALSQSVTAGSGSTR